MTFALTCLNRQKIGDSSLGLNEPSGLALAHGGDGLWTVSDDTGRVFRLGLDGKLDKEKSFDVPISGLEGITGDDGGRFLFVVREETNAVFKLDIEAREVANRRRLSKMKGFKPIKRSFTDDKDENKGLEGITWNTHTGTLFALKEGEPGLFIEISPGLDRILSHARPGPKNGFVDPRKKPEKVDFSGICYDPGRKAFWIVSHKARRVFLYSRAHSRVVHSAPLDWAGNGARKSVKQAEGVAFDPTTNCLHVVCDTNALLYVYQVEARPDAP